MRKLHVLWCFFIFFVKQHDTDKSSTEYSMKLRSLVINKKQRNDHIFYFKYNTGENHYNSNE